MIKSLIGCNIKRIRKSKKITRQKLAKEIGISDSTLAGYENGHRLPNIENLIKIADILNTSIDLLCGRDCYEDKISSLEKEINTLTNIFGNLSNNFSSINNVFHFLNTSIKDFPTPKDYLFDRIKCIGKLIEDKQLTINDIKKILDKIVEEENGNFDYELNEEEKYYKCSIKDVGGIIVDWSEAEDVK